MVAPVLSAKRQPAPSVAAGVPKEELRRCPHEHGPYMSWQWGIVGPRASSRTSVFEIDSVGFSLRGLGGAQVVAVGSSFRNEGCALALGQAASASRKHASPFRKGQIKNARAGNQHQRRAVALFRTHGAARNEASLASPSLPSNPQSNPGAPWPNKALQRTGCAGR